MKKTPIVLVSVLLVGLLLFSLVTLHYKHQRNQRDINVVRSVLVVIADYMDAIKLYDETNRRSLEAIKYKAFDKFVQDYVSNYTNSRELFNKVKIDITTVSSKDESVMRAIDRLKIASEEMLNASDILTRWLIAYSQQDYDSTKRLSPKEAYAKRSVCDRYFHEVLDLIGLLFNKLNIENDDIRYKYARYFTESDHGNISLLYTTFNIKEPDNLPVITAIGPASKWGMIRLMALPRNVIDRAVFDVVLASSPSMLDEYIAVIFPKNLSESIKNEVTSYINTFRGPIKPAKTLSDCSTGNSCMRVHVLADSGINLEREIISRGWAKAIDSIDYDGKQELLEMQNEAKSKGVGIWSPQHVEKRQSELKLNSKK